MILRRSLLLSRLLFLAILTICSSQVMAQESGEAARDEDTSEAQRAGLRVYVDPNTGQLTSQPTAEQRQRLDQMIRAQREARDRPDLRPFALRDGGVGVKLDDRFHAGLRVELDSTGSWRILCDDQQPLDHEDKPAARDDDTPRDRAGNPVQ